MVRFEIVRPGPRSTLFGSILVLAFLVNFGRVAFAPLADYFIGAGVSPALAGLAATAVWLGSAIPRLPVGYLLTIFRRYQVLTGVSISLALSAMITAFSPGIWLTVVGAFAIGLAAGGYFVSANPLISELYPKNVGLALGLRGMSTQIASVIAPSAIAASIYLGSWRLAFIGMSVLAILITLTLPISAKKANIPDFGRDDKTLLGAIKAQQTLILSALAFVGIAGFIWQGVFNFYITYLGVEKSIGSDIATVLLTAMFAAGIPAWVLSGKLADRFSFIFLMLTTLAGFAVCVLLLTFVEGIVMIALVSFALSFLVYSLFPISDAYLLATLPDEHRASAYAGFSAVMMIMHAPGSFIVGILVGTGVPFNAIFHLLGVISIGLVLVLAFLASREKIPRGVN